MTPLRRKYGVLPLRLARVKYCQLKYRHYWDMCVVEKSEKDILRPPLNNMMKMRGSVDGLIFYIYFQRRNDHFSETPESLIFAL